LPAQDFTGPSDVEDALQSVGELLEEAGERFAIVIIGGAALQLLGVISRNTRDVDVIAFAEPPTTRARLARPAAHLPAPLQRAILAVAKDRNLPENWLNAGPAGQWNLPSPLPPGFESRVAWRSFAALDVGIPDRLDFIGFKLEAAADQLNTQEPNSNRHFNDLQALAPTPDEFEVAARWVKANNDDGFHRKVDHVVSLITEKRGR
jgi:hypothetical protein